MKFRVSALVVIASCFASFASAQTPPTAVLPAPQFATYAVAYPQALQSGQFLVIGIGVPAPPCTIHTANEQRLWLPCIATAVELPKFGNEVIVGVPHEGSLYLVAELPAGATAADVEAKISVYQQSQLDDGFGAQRPVYYMRRGSCAGGMCGVGGTCAAGCSMTGGFSNGSCGAGSFCLIKSNPPGVRTLSTGSCAGGACAVIRR